MKQIKISLMICLIFFVTHSCSNSDVNPIPLIENILPNSRAMNLPEFTLTINGSGFTEESEIIVNGSSQKTEFISDTQLACEITPPVSTSLLSRVQSLDDLDVKVSNPEPGGGVSKSSTLTFTPNFTFETFTQIPLTEEMKNSIDFFPYHQYYDQHRVFIAWSAFNQEIQKSELFYITSEDQGTIWSKSKKLSIPFDFDNIRTTYSETWGHISFVYLESNSVYLIESDDFGNSWKSPFLIWNNNSEYEPLFVSMLIHNSGVMDLIFSMDSDLFLFHKPSDSNSWEKTELFREDSTYYREFTTGSDNQIYYYWNRLKFDTGHIFPGEFNFKFSDSYNSSWSPELEVEMADGYLSDLFVNKNSGLTLFYGYTFLKRISSNDGGISWSEPKIIAENQDPFGLDKWINKDSIDNLNIVYKEDEKFLFKRSINSGNDFSEAIPFFNKTKFQIFDLKVFIDKTGELHFIWEEPGKRFIYATTVN